MTGPLEFVEAAHARAEQVAQRAHGTWEGVAEGWRIRIVDELGRTVVHLPIRLSSEDTTGDYATAEHVETHDPAAVLRRVTAERKELARHKPTGADFDGQRQCLACGGYTIHPGLGTRGHREPWPCTVIQTLAEAWGWQEEGQHG